MHFNCFPQMNANVWASFYYLFTKTGLRAIGPAVFLLSYPFDEVFKNFSENMSAEGNGKPLAVIRNIATACIREMFCLLSLICLLGAAQCGPFWIERKLMLPTSTGTWQYYQKQRNTFERLFKKLPAIMLSGKAKDNLQDKRLTVAILNSFSIQSILQKSTFLFSTRNSSKCELITYTTVLYQ